jgi:hypothetical protein
MNERTRREILAAMTSAAVSAPGLQAQQHQHDAGLVPVAGAGTPGVYKAKVFTAAEMKWLGFLVDAIIPPTDTPGASDAGVPAFIDRRASANPALAVQLRSGMKALDSESTKRFQVTFAALDATRVTELLTPLEAALDSDSGRFFKAVKDLTVEGYYTSQAGLTQELGWHGNTFLTEFRGCTHPEHQS